MYIVNDDTLINPLQVESIKYKRSTLVDAGNRPVISFIVTMASGASYEVNRETNGSKVEACLKELVYHIDTSNGQNFGATVKEGELEEDAGEQG